MAKVLLIRDLTTEADAALERYKKESGFRSNTNAAQAMMVRYYETLKSSNNWEKLFFEVNSKLNKLKAAYKRHQEAEELFKQLIDGKEPEPLELNLAKRASFSYRKPDVEEE